MRERPEWVKCIGPTTGPSLCGRGGLEWRFVDHHHARREVEKEGRLVPCEECITQTEKRTCGECVVCCTYLPIPQIEKEGMTHCPDSLTDEPEVPGERVCFTGTGCKIYGEHPEVCKGYGCAWLAGHGEDEDRPDRSGVLIDRTKQIGNALECKSLWQDACDEPAGRRAIERISKAADMAALVLSFGETRLLEVRAKP